MKFSDDQMQQLGDLLDSKLEEKLEQKLEEKLEQKLEEKFEQKLQPIRKDLRKIKSDLRTTIEFFDEAHLSLRMRVDRVEDHLHLTHSA